MVAIALAVTVLSGTGVSLGSEYYAGKTITFIVGYSAGGPTDTTWRSIAPYLKKHIPGEPNIVIKNVAGGGGLKATNFVYERAKPDGLTFLTNPMNPIGFVIGAPGVRADYTKMRFIGGGALPRVTYMRTGVAPGGLKDRADIVKLKTVKLGGLRPDSQLDLVGRLSLDLLGLKMVYVSGYRGSAKYRQALASGEIDVASTGITSYRSFVEPTLVKNGSAIGLYYHPGINANGTLKKIPSITDMPDFVTFFEQVKGHPPSGPKWELLSWIYKITSELTQSILGPPGTPDEAVMAMRKGYLGLIRDKDYIKSATEKFGAPLSFVMPEEGEKIILSLRETDPKTVESLKAYIQSSGGKR